MSTRTHAEKLREELTLARIDRHSGQLEELDVEGILAFAERILPRAADLWVQASLDQRQPKMKVWWTRPGSNRLPHECHARAGDWLSDWLSTRFRDRACEAKGA